MRSALQRLKTPAIDIRVNIELKNACCVLLTRARQRMVIFVPPGAKRDRTRKPDFYEGISNYLADLGVPQV